MGPFGGPHGRAMFLETTRQGPEPCSRREALRPGLAGKSTSRWESRRGGGARATRDRGGRAAERSAKGLGAAAGSRLRSGWRRGRALAGTAFVSAMTLSQASGTGAGGFLRSGVARIAQAGIGHVARRLGACSSDSDCQGSDADMEALDNEGKTIFCDPACEDTGTDIFGGTWCNHFGLEGCRACDVYNCEASSGPCVPCSGELPEETTPAPLEEGSTLAPVSPGETDPPFPIGETLNRALPFLLQPRKLQSGKCERLGLRW
ncbi:unnamed protein product [Ectocarpus sp. CCAP 1310/34]|nr:unnamed protein product [Ectocarpus sp. CCAP 1310/34]